MAVNESIQRKAVVYSQSNIHKWAYGLNKEIEKIKGKGDWWKPTAYLGKLPGKQVVEQFERTLDYARQVQAWHKSPGELQDFYLRNFQRNPSLLETRAYFNYVKLIEGDRMLGEIAEFRNRARVGAEQHRIRILGPDGKPISVPALGSGTFTTRDDGDKVYTAKVPVDFEAGKNKSVQFAWKQNSEFQKGSYKIEIYHNGFKIGEGTRELKKGGLFG